MLSDQLVLLGVGVAIVLAAWLPLALERRPISLPIVLVGVGAAVFALPWFAAPDPRDHLEITRAVTEVGVLVALLGAGIAIDRPLGWRRWATTWRLLSVGMLLSIAGITAVAVVVLGVDLPTALLLGAVLAPTDPVLAGDVQVGEPVLEERRADDEDEVRFGLTSEAGANDGLAFPFVHLALAAAAAATQLDGGSDWLVHWSLVDLLVRIALGVAVGWACGSLLGRLVFDGAGPLPAISVSSQGFVALGITMVAYGLTELVHGYGFLAVFLAAVSMRRGHRTDEYHAVMHRFAGEIEQLVSGVLLVLFGGTMLTLLAGLGWRGLLVSVLVIAVVRPAAGSLALIRSRLARPERRAISFFGIRGVGSVYYLAYAATIDPDGSQAVPSGIERLWPVVTCTIALSIFVHGATATGVMQRLDRRRRRRRRRPEPLLAAELPTSQP